jgi:ATP-dependent DNA helicase RecG
VESTEFDIYPILAQGMGPRLHWFPGGVTLSELAKVMVAMANLKGGTIYLGINPKSGHIQGIADVQAAHDLIFRACLSAEPTLVLPVPKIINLQDEQVLQISIPDGLPHVYNYEGRYFWRVGKQSNPIPARDLRRLLVERGMIQFESRVPADAHYTDLDGSQVEAYVQTYLKATSLPPGDVLPGRDEILRMRGCLKRVGDELRPTYAGLLLFGHSPQRWLPTANILAARFSGESYGDRFIKEEMNGSLPMQLQKTEKFLRANLQNVVQMEGLQHQESLEYPFDAVRELVVNAIAHRDYNMQGDSIHLNIFSDHLEVSSPGKLPGPMTLNNLLEARFSRNPIVVQVLADLGYVEKLGYGLDRVVSLMHESSLSAPKFEEVARTFRVTIFSSLREGISPQEINRYQHLDLNPRQVMALKYLDTHPRITNREYKDLCPQVHAETLRRDLADLVGRGLLIKIGDKRATYYILK